ncbi:MAG: TlpA family protein disulfide reductase [Chloroflexi bacterium]|nr:TlpA family protein disulfide reductase [Chloroflexota bacterium]
MGARISALAVLSVLLAACASPAPRAPATDVKDFSLVAYQGARELGGQESTFARVFEQGKPVVLNFWAGDCPPCRGEMPAFQKVADEYQGKVLVVGVDVGVFTLLGTHDEARHLLAELHVHYPAAYAVDATPLRLYEIRSMPTTVFFDAKGQVVDVVAGMLLEAQLRSKIQKLAAG